MQEGEVGPQAWTPYSRPIWVLTSCSLCLAEPEQKRQRTEMETDVPATSTTGFNANADDYSDLLARVIESNEARSRNQPTMDDETEQAEMMANESCLLDIFLPIDHEAAKDAMDMAHAYYDEGFD